VVGWGKTWVHSKGWRCKYALPVALLHWPERRTNVREPFAEEDWTDAVRWNDIQRQIADRYRIPLVATPEELTAVLDEYLGGTRCAS
jgi:hypothetical protein